MLPNDFPPLCDSCSPEKGSLPACGICGDPQSLAALSSVSTRRAALPGRRNENCSLLLRGLGECSPGCLRARPGAQRQGPGSEGWRGRGAQKALSARRTWLHPAVPALSPAPKPPSPTAPAGPQPPPGPLRASLPARPRLLLPGKWLKAARSPCPPRGGSPTVPGPGALFAGWSWRGDGER